MRVNSTSISFIYSLTGMHGFFKPEIIHTNVSMNNLCLNKPSLISFIRMHCLLQMLMLLLALLSQPLNHRLPGRQAGT